MNTLRDLYIYELQDMVDAEDQLRAALPRMINAAVSEELRWVLRLQLEQTEEQIERLELILQGLDVPPTGGECLGMQGLIDEEVLLLEEDAEIRVGDAGLISVAQRMELYQIAVYGTLRAWAQQLGEHEAVRLLQRTLDEESEANDKLTAIATSINQEADYDVSQQKAA